MPSQFTIPKVFFDSGLVIAGSASQHGAAFILLQLSELGLIKGYISQQVVDECRKNLLKKLPEALPVFEKVILHSLKVVKNPSQKDITSYTGMAHPKDVSILTAAIKSGAQYLVTFNTKDYYPEVEIGLVVLEPGELLQLIRKRLSELAD